MSFLGDALGFELFHAKDLWNRLKKDPKRLVLGVDPASTKVWNAVLGRDDEPLVDQMGGAYGGHMLSAFGNKDGGVYKRAQDAGINTKAGGALHDAAHVISALFAGGYGLGQMGGATQSPFGFSQQSISGQAPNFGGTPGFNPMAGGGAPTGGGLGSNMNWMQLAQSMQSPAQQQAPQMPPMAPPRQQQRPAPVGPLLDSMPRRQLNGRNYVQVDGRWYEDA